MKIEETYLAGCFVVTPLLFRDQRGFFCESFHQQKFEQATGLPIQFVQDNLSKSSRGVLRGLHYQKGEHAQAKLVSVMRGAVLDVCVDIRKGSPTYGNSFSLVLSDENRLQLFIPRGFAHGFVVLSETAEFFYKCDNFYAPAHEAGIHYSDPDLAIDWQLDKETLVISEKDQKLPLLREIEAQ
jgi:dTDP-4-dehydrorhamnose 3,5-epimerase